MNMMFKEDTGGNHTGYEHEKRIYEKRISHVAAYRSPVHQASVSSELPFIAEMRLRSSLFSPATSEMLVLSS